MSFRPKEIEEHTNLYVLHPVSHRLAAGLARTPLHPNAVSFTGIAFGLLAALAYYNFREPGAVWVGFAFMVIWHLLDGTDGHLARLTGKSSTTGKVIDGFADYTVYLAVYVALAAALVPEMGAWVAAVAALSAASHVLQAAAYERERETYLFWVYSGEAGKGAPRTEMPKNPLLFGLYYGYLKVQNFLDSSEAVKQHGFDLAIGPNRRALAAEKYKALYAAHVRQWWMVSANTHTVAVFLFTALGTPFYYFMFEIFLLNAIFLVLLADKRRRDREFMAWLAGLPKRQAPTA
ncbi:MAG TPA: CDP-alcohol phosphatidyltransferase family protein [Sphingomonadales bacterium]|nr:CDP-alcohol phosphatidyltransferase family protein [Sphingomonadales bacterium]